jgi:2-oxoacid:acceptor oxidoreductase, alpha subunit
MLCRRYLYVILRSLGVKIANEIDISWMTGGKQGSGIDVALGLFSRTMIRYGYHIYGYREYHSNIIGMHSYFIVRTTEAEKNSLGGKVDLAVFFDKESVFGEKNRHSEAIHSGHVGDIAPGGTLIIDSAVDRSMIQRSDIRIIQIDSTKIIYNVAARLKKGPGELAITRNVIAVASSAYLMGIDTDTLMEMIKEEFRGKPVTVIQTDSEIAKETIAYMSSEKIQPIMQLKKREHKSRYMYTEGFTAAALGKAIAGCKIQIYYPITPASDESTFIESHPEFKMRVVQPESELAVICMVTGAAIAGARAATSTSGPGLSLMTEAITYAGITETPIVVVDHQRGAPATGQPTRTEQGDLAFVVSQGHGDFGRIIVAPGTVNQYVEMTANAFNYAERYQLPVIVLGEKAIAQASISMDADYIESFKGSYKIDRGKLNFGNVRLKEGEDYKRFKFTDDKISERIIPGNPSAVMWLTGDEHDEYGHPYEEAKNRTAMMEKRLGKDALILRELPQSAKYGLTGDPSKADLLVVSWGGATGGIIDCADGSISFLQVRLILPFPEEIKGIIGKAKKTVCIESNISGQLRAHIASKTGILIENQILKYNGRPMKYDELANAISKIKNGEKKVVLNDD